MRDPVKALSHGCQPSCDPPAFAPGPQRPAVRQRLCGGRAPLPQSLGLSGAVTRAGPEQQGPEAPQGGLAAQRGRRQGAGGCPRVREALLGEAARGCQGQSPVTADCTTPGPEDGEHQEGMTTNLLGKVQGRADCGLCPSSLLLQPKTHAGPSFPSTACGSVPRRGALKQQHRGPSIGRDAHKAVQCRDAEAGQPSLPLLQRPDARGGPRFGGRPEPLVQGQGQQQGLGPGRVPGAAQLHGPPHVQPALRQEPELLPAPHALRPGRPH
mmetsp:Transcript_10795/g.33717  ORF Transcript_10795/g.33717 Transcript_10795/m.33717 type:complete len:268 (-) Transcript_10795:628-1431(-)